MITLLDRILSIVIGIGAVDDAYDSSLENIYNFDLSSLPSNPNNVYSPSHHIISSVLDPTSEIMYLLITGCGSNLQIQSVKINTYPAAWTALFTVCLPGSGLNGIYQFGLLDTVNQRVWFSVYNGPYRVSSPLSSPPCYLSADRFALRIVRHTKAGQRCDQCPDKQPVSKFGPVRGLTVFEGADCLMFLLRSIAEHRTSASGTTWQAS